MTIVVNRDRLDVHAELEQMYGTEVILILDRRTTERRQRSGLVISDRRISQRRVEMPQLQQESWRRFGYFAVQS